METPYTLQGPEWWQEVLAGDTDENSEPGMHVMSGSSEPEEKHIHEASGEEHHDHVHEHDHDEGEKTPAHITLREGRLESPGGLILLLEDMLRGEFGSVVRAKGTLRAGGEWVRFDVADGLYAVTGTEDDDPATQCVFIGRNLDREALRGRFHAAGDRMEQ